MKNMTLTEFTEKTASGEPTPGGGSISALAGALSSALSAMVARLTLGKEKYADAAPEMEEAIPKLQELSRELLLDITKDSESFDLYMKALALPKVTDEDKAKRKEAMQAGLKAAVSVPLSVSEKAFAILPYARLMVQKGNATALTDALVSAMMARTAVLGAAANVKINLKSIKDPAYTEEIYRKVKALEEDAIRMEEEIRALASETLD